MTTEEKKQTPLVAEYPQKTPIPNPQGLTLDQLFLDAVKDDKSDKALLVSMLQVGANVYTKIFAGDTVLQLAEKNNTINKLLDAISEAGEIACTHISPKNSSSLRSYAVKFNHTNLITMIDKFDRLNKKPDFDQLLLSTVVFKAKNAAPILLQAGAKIYSRRASDKKTILQIAAENGFLPDLLDAIEQAGPIAITQKRPKNEKSFELLTYAARCNHAKLVQEILSASDNPRKDHDLDQALLFAVAYKAKDVLLPLLRAGANLYTTRASDKKAILQIAAENGLLPHLVDAVVQAGTIAVTQKRPKGKEDFELLTYAAMCNHAKLIQEILAASDNPEQDHDLNQALLAIAEYKAKDVLLYLLQAGAKLYTTRESDNKTILQIADENGLLPDLVQALVVAESAKDEKSSQSFINTGVKPDHENIKLSNADETLKYLAISNKQELLSTLLECGSITSYGIEAALNEIYYVTKKENKKIDPQIKTSLEKMKLALQPQRVTPPLTRSPTYYSINSTLTTSMPSASPTNSPDDSPSDSPLQIEIPPLELGREFYWAKDPSPRAADPFKNGAEKPEFSVINLKPNPNQNPNNDEGENPLEMETYHQ